MMKRLVSSHGNRMAQALSVPHTAGTTKKNVSYVSQNGKITPPQPVANGKFLAANIRSMPGESSVKEFMSHAEDGQYFFMSTQPTQLPKHLAGKSSLTPEEFTLVHPGHVMSAVLDVKDKKVRTVSGTVTNFLPVARMDREVALDPAKFVEHADKDMANSKPTMDNKDLAGVMVAVRVEPEFVSQHKTTVAQLPLDKTYNLNSAACSNTLIENVTGKPSTTPTGTQTAGVTVIKSLTQSYDLDEKREVNQAISAVGLNISGIEKKPFPRISDDKATEMIAAKKNSIKPDQSFATTPTHSL